MKNMMSIVKKTIPLLLFALLLACCDRGFAVRAESQAYDLLLPDVDSRYYTEEEISGMSLQVV